ncbi:hypothetical protein NQ176_g2855 [Zarea fungicola]|uniref:Uncharacterized protein n=1 Tax=Zarea fungicola TaxID=93591 RepID=A0ACC1NP07_9HYPO|nr:hypothetical protein NQ176_g2855 [Lecanicillium fungicola]
MEATHESNGEKRVAIVTGAASGIGKALATQLIEDDWLVACCDIDQEAGSAVAAELGSNASFFQVDVCDYDAQARVFTMAIPIVAPFTYSTIAGKPRYPPKPALKSIKACYESFLFGVQLAIHFMRKNKVPGGQIIATSSIAAVHPHQTFPEYCGAKAAINHFVRTAAPILRIKENITLNAILPGIVLTGAVPQASINATRPEHLTPIETVVKAYSLCLTQHDLNAEFANGATTKRACTVWEPLFEEKHHEKSELPDAIQ